MMTNETDLSHFSNKMTEAANEAVRSIAQNYSQADFSHQSDITSHVEKSNKYVDSIPEVSTMVNIVTEKAESLATSAIRKLVTTTLSTTTSMSSNQLSDTSTSSSLLTFGHGSSHQSNTFSVTDIPTSTLATTSATIYEVHDTSEAVISHGSEELMTASDHHHMEDSAHQSMQNHIQNLNSPKNIKYLIEVSIIQIIIFS